MAIHVKLMSGATVTLSVTSSDSITTVKEKVVRQSQSTLGGIPWVRLIFAGKHVGEFLDGKGNNLAGDPGSNERTLCDYNIVAGATLHQVLVLRGTPEGVEPASAETAAQPTAEPKPEPEPSTERQRVLECGSQGSWLEWPLAPWQAAEETKAARGGGEGARYCAKLLLASRL